MFVPDTGVPALKVELAGGEKPRAMPDAMDRQEAIRRIQHYVDVNLYGNKPSGYWEAVEALKTAPAGMPPELLEAFFDKLLTFYPEMPPHLEEMTDEALAAFGRVAGRHPKSPWAAVLGRYSLAGKKPERLRWAYQRLRLAFTAPSSPDAGNPQERAAIEEASQDPALVSALREIWPSFDGVERHRRPLGWAGILMREGSQASVAPLHVLIAEEAEEGQISIGLDDVRNLAPDNPSSHVSQLLEVIRSHTEPRDKETGQEDLLEALGLSKNPPRQFSLSVALPAKSGHYFRLLVQSDGRRSNVMWFATLGKSKLVFEGRSTGQYPGKLQMPFFTFGDIHAWLERAAQALKTRWIGPLQIQEEGFDPPIAPAVERWLAPVMAPPPAGKTVRGASAKTSKKSKKSVKARAPGTER